MERKPLRHGWGGDKRRRREVLRDKEEEGRERELYPEKYGDQGLGQLANILEQLFDHNLIK